MSDEETTPPPGWPEESAQRLQRARALREQGFDPYPTRFERSHLLGEVVAAHGAKTLEALEALAAEVRVAGRILTKRGHGKASFATIGDGETRLQLYVRQDVVGEQAYRWTAAHPNLRWLTANASGLRVQVEDISEHVAALALQGPTSGRLLQAVCSADIAGLGYFRATSGEIAGVPVDVSRTGYTGDLGYEIWMPWASALAVWDALVGAGAAFDLHPAGMLALDVARIEAGLLLVDVDFQSSRKAQIASHQYSPFELGMARLVDLGKGPFVGRAALVDEHRRGHARQIVGLEVEWTAVEALHEAVGLPPTAPAGTSRVAVPVYKGGAQVGRATSTAWSPTLKKLIALATVDRPHFTVGTRLEMEVTVDAARHRAAATVVPTPFFNPPRKRRVEPTSPSSRR